MKNRRDNILKNLYGLGINPDDKYAPEEALELCLKLQDALKVELYSLAHGISFDARDIMLLLKGEAEEYGGVDLPEYKRLLVELNELSYTIARLKTGLGGEARLKRMLKVLEYEDSTRILFNIALKDELNETEYDAIVINPAGVFMIESKHYKQAMVIDERGILKKKNNPDFEYNIAQHLITKEYLIRKALKDCGSFLYKPILLMTNEHTDLEDNYGRIDITYDNNIVFDIREISARKGNLLSDETIEYMSEELKSCSHEIKMNFKLDSDQLIEDFASVVSFLEMKAMDINGDEELESEPSRSDSEEHDCKEKYEQEETEKGGWILPLVAGTSVALSVICIAVKSIRKGM